MTLDGRNCQAAVQVVLLSFFVTCFLEEVIVQTAVLFYYIKAVSKVDARRPELPSGSSGRRVKLFNFLLIG